MTNNTAKVTKVTDTAFISNKLYGQCYFWTGSDTKSKPEDMVTLCNRHDIQFKNNEANVYVVSGKDMKAAFNKKKSKKFPVEDNDIFYLLDWDDFASHEEAEKIWKNGKLFRYLDDFIDPM